jgi:RNA polymerase sigma-70 factor (ECF subfamily)
MKKLDEEQKLIEAAKKGDINAFNKLIKNYTQMIYSFSFKICRDEEKAKSTLQDTLINIYKSLKTFDGKSKFSTWIYRVVANNCLMLRRNNKSGRFVSVEDLQIDSDTDYFVSSFKDIPSKDMLNNELKEKLDEAIKKLPLKYRMVFLLRDVEGLSIEETKNILNLSVPVIKSRLYRARNFLRNELQDYYEAG